MKNTSALFIIDDVIANQLLELDDEYISYQVLHEESFYKHLLDVQEFPVNDEYSNKESHKALLVIRSWQEVREILKEVQKEKNINAWKRLFPCQLYADGAYGEDTIIQNLSCAERLLIRAVQEQKYVMFYC